MPATAVAPILTTVKAEALRITVGTTVVPSIGQAAKKVTVSLKPDDLLGRNQPRRKPSRLPLRRNSLGSVSAPSPGATPGFASLAILAAGRIQPARQRSGGQLGLACNTRQ